MEDDGTESANRSTTQGTTRPREVVSGGRGPSFVGTAVISPAIAATDAQTLGPTTGSRRARAAAGSAISSEEAAAP